MLNGKDKIRVFSDVIWQFLLLLLLGLTVYSNVLQGEFVSDDYLFVVDNSAIRSLSDLPAIWRAFNTRFLTGLGFAFNYHIHGLNVFGYHLVNILFHVANSFFVYVFARLLYQTPRLRRELSSDSGREVALFASLLFLVHPVQTQAVSFVSQRFICQAVFFYLLTLLFYLHARITRQDRQRLFALLAMGAALLSKEMAVTIPIALIFLEWLVSGDGPWREKIKALWPFFLLPMILPAVLSVDHSGSLIGLKGQVGGRFFNLHYFLTEINVLRTYLRLFVWPVNLTHDYDYPVVRQIWELRTFLSLSLLAGLLAAAWRWRRRSPLISFAILWFFMATSVEVVVVSVVNRWVIAEHWMYLPMVGLCIGAAYGIDRLFRVPARRQTALAVLLVIFAVMSYERNNVWRNEIGFWQDNVARTPGHSRVYFALGNAYFNKSRYQQALENYLMAERLLKDQAPREDWIYASELYNNLGIMYYQSFKNEKALRSFQISLRYNKRNAKTLYNLGRFYLENSELEKAGDTFRDLVSLFPGHVAAHYYLGYVLGQQGRLQEACQVLGSAGEGTGPQVDREIIEKTSALRADCAARAGVRIPAR